MKCKILLTTIFLFGYHFIYSQEKKESIGTEVVNVVKLFTPTILDANKIRENVPQNDTNDENKLNVEYSIFSVPVASTFTPSKGVAARVDKLITEPLFTNFASLSAGNYGTITATFNNAQVLENDHFLNVNLNHLSSQGGIKNVDLSNKFSETQLDVTFGLKTKSLSWNADMALQNKSYNWYGADDVVLQSSQIAFADLKQSYNLLAIGGKIALAENIFKEAQLHYDYFSDGYQSIENRVVVQPKIELTILNEKFNFDFNFDYVNGSFKNEFVGTSKFNYGYSNVSFKPNYTFNTSVLSLSVGANMVYSSTTETGKNKFYLYPNIVASYKIVNDFMIGFAGVEGGLIQNSYHNFVQVNNFLAPNLLILPTDKKFDVYAGLRGKFSNAIGYTIKASVVNEDYKPLFKNTIFNNSITSNGGFLFGNSFDIVYDTVKTFSILGELTADFSKKTTFKIQGVFSKYIVSNEVEPWNLPNLQLNSTLDFEITKKWSAGFKLFFVGMRKDQFIQITNFTTVNSIDKILDGYLDINANVNYKLNSKWNFFLKGNNLANQNYQKWSNYAVQGIQVLLGANYKFDF